MCWMQTTLTPDAAGTFARRLAAFGDNPALVTGDETIYYKDLAARVDEFAARLGSKRTLVVVEAANQTDSVVAYLACLKAGHPVALTSTDSTTATALADTYEAGFVYAKDETTWTLTRIRQDAPADLHDDLALLMSTSGSTGSAKHVRLSHANVESNASAISGYLNLTEADRAITSLPMEYCYGLSVINSHLASGATVILSEDSVIDDDFWETARGHSATSFAGVPYTFELLEKSGFAEMDLPSLRYVTQAGGRMPAERVQRYAELGRRLGWDLFVMYGQTEATARMAYVPPKELAANPSSIGRPIPGGAFEIAPTDYDGSAPDSAREGEIVYSGPNVMLGYATSAADLARGRDIDKLYTGDIGRRLDNGMYEVTGRKSRFLKLYGKRLDLAGAEAILAAAGINAACCGTDDLLVAGIETTNGHETDPRGRVTQTLATRLAIPPRKVRVVTYDSLPRLANGKPDYRSITASAAAGGPAAPDAAAGDAAEARSGAVSALFAEVLGEQPGSDSTFVSLGGDSLSYVEMSMALEDHLGYLPESWDKTPVGKLEGLAPRKKRLRSTETSIFVRAVAIVAIVLQHVGLSGIIGGAHTLLAVSGMNFARFSLPATESKRSSYRIAVTLAKIAVPSIIWIGLVVLVSDRYSTANLFFGNVLVGPESFTAGWRYWYIEMLVQLLALLALLFAFAPVRRAETRRPFLFTLAIFAVAFVLRFDMLGVIPGVRYVNHPVGVAWIFMLGWLIQRADTTRLRLVVTALIGASVWGFYGDIGREVMTTGILAALMWIPQIPVPKIAYRLIGALAGASLYIYLTHFQVYDWLLAYWPRAVVAVACLVVGYVVWRIVEWITRHLGHAAFLARRARQAVTSSIRSEQASLARKVPSWPTTKPDAAVSSRISKPASPPATNTALQMTSARQASPSSTVTAAISDSAGRPVSTSNK